MNLVPESQIYCEACGTTLTADLARARYCLHCDLMVCPGCWKAAASRCRACAAASGPNGVTRGASIRTARRADRRLREVRREAATLADDRPGGAVVRVEPARLAVKTAFAERVGMSALRRVTGARAARARRLGDRIRRHAVQADGAIKLAEVTLASQMGPASAWVALSAVDEPNSSVSTMRERHGRQLQGFALLLTLGDKPAAAQLAADALEAGAVRAHQLQHLGREAAWLRHSVVRAATRRRVDPNRDEPSRRAALTALGVNDEAHVALSALSMFERAAVVASAVEGLDEPDVGTVVELDPEPSEAGPDGPIVARTRAIAARVLA